MSSLSILVCPTFSSCTHCGATADDVANHLRNRDGLESALARPASYAHYEKADLALQATALAHGIAEGQQFIDANKRTALVAMLTFLEINGYRVEATDPELADWIISFSAGKSPQEVAALLRVALRGIDQTSSG